MPSSSPPVVYRPEGRPLYGPFIHQLNKNGLGAIKATQRLIASEGRYNTGVRAVAASLRPTPVGQREAIEFYTHEPPEPPHPTNREVLWPRPEGQSIAIILTRVALPGMELEVLVKIDLSPTP